MSRLALVVGCVALLLIGSSALLSEASLLPYSLLPEYYNDAKTTLKTLARGLCRPALSDGLLGRLSSYRSAAASLLSVLNPRSLLGMARRPSLRHMIRLPSLLGIMDHHVRGLRHAVDYWTNLVQGAVPPEVQDMARHFVDGVLSAGLIGHGLTAANAAEESDSSSGGAVSTSMLQWLTRALPDALHNHPSEKFIFSMGALCAQLLLLRILYQPPYRNEERNRVNRFCSSTLGMVMLVVCLALPHPLMDMAVPLVMYGSLSCSVYTPAMVIGCIVRPYLVSLIRRSSSYALASQALPHIPWLSHVSHWSRYTVAWIEVGVVAAIYVVRKLLLSRSAMRSIKSDSDAENANMYDDAN